MPSEYPVSKQVRLLDTSMPAELFAAMAWSSDLYAALLDPALWRESLTPTPAPRTSRWL